MTASTKRFLVCLSLLAVAGVNLYLLKHDFSTLDRINIVHNAEPVRTADLEDTAVYPAEIIPAAREDYYFSQELGVFERFLVKKGDAITFGTPLYEYTVTNFDQQLAVYEAEVERIDAELAAGQRYASTLSSLLLQLPTTSGSGVTSNSPMNSVDPSNLVVTIEVEVGIDVSDATLAQTRALLSQQEAEQLLALDELNAERTKYTRLIESLGMSSLITVVSETDGVVSHVSDDLGEPLLSVDPYGLHARAEVTAEDALGIMTAMPARITSQAAGETTAAEVVSNTMLPIPQENGEPLYPIEMLLTDPNERWLKGQPVIAAIQRQFFPAAPVLQLKSIDRDRAFQLTTGGTVERVDLETGIHDGADVHVLSPLTADDTVAFDYTTIERNSQPYTIPLSLHSTTWSDWNTPGTKTGWLYWTLGLIEK